MAQTSKAPPDERGGNGYVWPTVTAPHLNSTILDGSWFENVGSNLKAERNPPR